VTTAEPNRVFQRTRVVHAVCIGAVAGGLTTTVLAGVAGWGAAAVISGATVGLAGLGALAMQVWGLLGRLERLNRCVVQDRPSQARCGGADAAAVLANQVAECLGRAVEKAEQARQRQDALTLENQLLIRQKNAAEQILQRIPDAVIVSDGFGRLVLANAAAEKVFDFKADRVRGQALADHLPHPEFTGLMAHSLQSKIPCVKHELDIVRDDGTRTFDCLISCLCDERGEVVSIVAVLHDITREKEVSRMKNDFVSHVSHELKTPLASINAYAEMLVDGEAQDEESIRHFCSIIQSQAQRLNRLIEDILNISRIESGLVKVEKKTLSVALLIHEAVDMIRSYAQEKNITIEEPAAILYDQAYADKDMLQQVIINLLSNAVKYTPHGGTISVAAEVNELDGLIRVTVKDTGVGIPPEDVDHVFDKFYRVEANKNVAKGTGLGLNLVKQIVEKVHDGTVFVESTVGQGSTFGFTLPLGAAEMAATR